MFFLSYWVTATAQSVTVLPSGITPAMNSSHPRLSYDAILALPSPQIGDIAYDLTFLCLRVYNGSKWVCTYQQPNDLTPNITALATAGGIEYDFVSGIAVDASGNVYITGGFQGTARFGGISKTSAGNADIFVAKYSSAGALQWVQTAEGPSYDGGRGIAVDVSGNVYITGYFYGGASFDGTFKASAGQVDIFVAKYNSSGVLQWVQTAGGASSDHGNSIAVDASGNVYIMGDFWGMVNFSGTSKTPTGNFNIFVAKYNSAGSLQWVQTAGGTGDFNGRCIAVDAIGNVYITGEFAGTASFGSTSKTSSGGADIFVAKYDPVGVAWAWVQTAGGTSYDFGKGIAVDASGNVYVTGSFQGTGSFGGPSQTSAGDADIFIAKYNSSGTWQWGQTAGGTSVDVGNSITVDPIGNVYITGSFVGTASFGSTSKTSAGGAEIFVARNDIFVAKYNSASTFQWVQTTGGTSSDIGNSIAVDASGNVYVTGGFQGTASFGSTAKTSAGSDDVFIVRLQQ